MFFILQNYLRAHYHECHELKANQSPHCVADFNPKEINP